jgi:hypothetical protein
MPTNGTDREDKRFTTLGFQGPKTFKEFLLLIVFMAATSVLGPIVRPYSDAIANYVFRVISTVIGNYYGRLLLEVLFVIVAYALYRLRGSQQRLYGSIECVFAMLTAWFAFNRMLRGITLDAGITLVGAGYILVRGLTNYSEGRAKSLRPKPLDVTGAPI